VLIHFLKDLEGGSVENEKKIRELIDIFFQEEFADSQCAEFTAYFIRRICRGVISNNEDVADASYNSLFWEKSMRSVIRLEADDMIADILSQDFRKLSDVLRKILTYTILNFHSHAHDNYFVSSYLKGMMLDTYDKLEPRGNNNELYFRVRGVLWDIIEDAYTGMINYGNTVLPEPPTIAPEN